MIAGAIAGIVAAVIVAAWLKTWTVPVLLAGFVLGYVVASAATAREGPFRRLRRLVLAVELGIVFVYEIVVSSIGVAKIVLSPSELPRPAIIACPLDLRGDGPITLLSVLVTLTPGTVAMDLSEDRGTLFLHVIDGSDPDRIVRTVKNVFEQRIRRAYE